MRCVMAAASFDPRYVVDACVWVSAFIPRDRFHAASRTWLSSQDTDLIDVACPSRVLPEVAGSVARVVGTNMSGYAAANHMSRLSTDHLIDVDDPLAHAAAHLAATLHLRGADAISVALAQRPSLPLITWDQELLDRAIHVIAVRTPSAD